MCFHGRALQLRSPKPAMSDIDKHRAFAALSRADLLLLGRVFVDREGSTLAAW